MNNDPRGRDVIVKDIEQRKKSYDELKPDEKDSFDMESLENPYADSRILFGTGDEEIRTVIAGIDVEVGEVLLADSLRSKGRQVDQFVKLPGDAIAEIREEFLDSYSFLRAGMANERTGDYKGAARLYRQGLEIDPQNEEILNALGWTLFQDGKSVEAVAELRKALAVDPDYAKAHNNLALALVELGELDEAATHWKRSLEIEPKPEIYSDYGFIMARLGKPQDALAAYQKAFALDPECASAHFNLAVSSVQAGKFADAESHSRVALRTKPNAETSNGLGFVLAAQGRPDDAAAEFRKAIEINPKYTPAYNTLADMLAKQGKLEEAASYYRGSLREKPSAAVHTDLGVVLRKLGKTDEAADEFRKRSPSMPLSKRRGAIWRP